MDGVLGLRTERVIGRRTPASRRHRLRGLGRAKQLGGKSIAIVAETLGYVTKTIEQHTPADQQAPRCVFLLGHKQRCCLPRMSGRERL